MQSKKTIKVSRKTLLGTAGAVWLIAGINVLIIGIKTWFQADMHWIFKLAFAILVFSLFFIRIFKPLYIKYKERINSLPKKNHPLSFFDAKGWLIMAFMITLGVTVRKFSLLPNNFIAPFYTGLSLALSSTGILFLCRWFKN